MDLTGVIQRYQLKETRRMQGSMDSELQDYSGPGILLRRLRDRGVESIELAGLADSEEWFDVPVVIALISNIEATEKVIPWDVQKQFLLDHADAVQKTFSPAAYASNKERMIGLQKSRARRLFPGLNGL